MKKFISVALVLGMSLVASLTCLAEGKMSNYTLTPAPASTVKAEDLSKVTFTFPEIDQLEVQTIRVDMYTPGTTEHKSYNSVKSLYLEPGEKAKFDGNTVVLDCSELYGEYCGDYDFVIDSYYFMTKDYETAPAIQWTYHLYNAFLNVQGSPAVGSMVTPSDFSQFTLTFSDIENLQLGNEFDANFDVYINAEKKSFGFLDRQCTIVGNTATIKVDPDWFPLQSAQMKFVFHKDAFIDAANDSKSPEFSIAYDVEIKQYECVVTPANDSALAITALHDLTFIFPGAKDVQLVPQDSFSGKRIHLYDRGAEPGQGWISEYGSYADADVVTSGDTVKVCFRVSDPRGGLFTLVADEGAFLIDGCKSAKIEVDYDLLEFDRNFDLKYAEMANAQLQLPIIVPEGMKIMAPSCFSDLKDENDQWVGYAEIDYLSSENRVWFTFRSKDDEALPDGKYHFDCRAKSVTFSNEDGILLDNRAVTVYFEIDRVSGISDIYTEEEAGQCLSLGGSCVSGVVTGVVIKNGRKVYVK